MKVVRNVPNGTCNPITVSGRGSATLEGEEAKALMGKDKIPFSQWKQDPDNCIWAKTYEPFRPCE